MRKISDKQKSSNCEEKHPSKLPTIWRKITFLWMNFHSGYRAFGLFQQWYSQPHCHCLRFESDTFWFGRSFVTTFTKGLWFLLGRPTVSLRHRETAPHFASGTNFIVQLRCNWDLVQDMMDRLTLLACFWLFLSSLSRCILVWYDPSFYNYCEL